MCQSNVGTQIHQCLMLMLLRVVFLLFPLVLCSAVSADCVSCAVGWMGTFHFEFKILGDKKGKYFFDSSVVCL